MFSLEAIASLRYTCLYMLWLQDALKKCRYWLDGMADARYHSGEIIC